MFTCFRHRARFEFIVWIEDQQELGGCSKYSCEPLSQQALACAREDQRFGPFLACNGDGVVAASTVDHDDLVDVLVDERLQAVAELFC